MVKSETFNLDILLNDKEQFLQSKQELKERIKSNYALRKTNATLFLSDEIIETNLGNTLLILMLLSPYVQSNIELTKKDLMLQSNISQRDLQKYFNEVLKKFKEKEGRDFVAVRKDIADTINELREISIDLNYAAGDTLSFYDFLDMSIKDKKSDEIFFPKIEYGLQFDEVESQFKEMGNRISELYDKHPDSDLYPFLKSKTGINTKQLVQAIGFVGLKPAMNGDVIPVPIDRNYLIGLGTMENYFINTLGTRKALKLLVHSLVINY